MKQISSSGCSACKDGNEFTIPFTMAFQPIIDISAGTVFAYEALVRQPGGEGGAAAVLSHINDENRYAFDQSCRVKAIKLATQLDLAATGAMLSINFMPGAVYSPAACLRLTLATAERLGMPTEKLIFEITEQEKLLDPNHLLSIITEYRKQGMKVAMDDFGAGHSGLNLLIDFPTDIVKLDMELTRNLHVRPRAMKIVQSTVSLARDLGSKVIAEGVETVEEYEAIRSCGIDLMQGYLLARPGFECLPAMPAALPASLSVAHAG